MPPVDLLYRMLGDVLRHGVRVGPEVVLQEILVSFGAGHQRVPPPDEPQPRPVFGRVRILHREAQAPRLEVLHYGVDHRLRRRRALAFGVRDDVERVPVELRIERQPAVAHGPHLDVHGVARSQRPVRLRRRHRVVVDEGALVTPLVTVHVVPARRVLQPRGRQPVAREGDRCPRLHRRKLFLTDVMPEAAPRHADASAEQQRMDRGPIRQIGVVPVVDAGADEDQALAPSAFGGGAPFPREPRQRLAAHAGVLFRPGRRVRRNIVVAGGVFPGKPARDAVLRHHQVVRRRHRGDGAVGQYEPLRGHPAHEGTTGCKVVEGDMCDLVRRAEERERRRDRGAVHLVFELQIPLALDVAPPRADAADWQPRHTGRLIPHQELPVAVLDVGILGEAAGAQQLSGSELTLVPCQFDQERRIRELAAVVQEVGHLALVMEFLEQQAVDRHPPGAVLAGVHGHPFVAEPCHLG